MFPLALAACSSGGSGGLPGGVTASCKIGWNGETSSGTTFFTSESAAVTATEAYDFEQGDGYGQSGMDSAGNTPLPAAQVIVSASATAAVGSVTIAWYQNGAELSSDPLTVGETITAGQSWSSDFHGEVPAGATSCQVVSWDGS